MGKHWNNFKDRLASKSVDAAMIAFDAGFLLVLDAMRELREAIRDIHAYTRPIQEDVRLAFRIRIGDHRVKALQEKERAEFMARFGPKSERE